MIDMHVRAHDEIDIVDAKACGGKCAHEGLIALQIQFRRVGLTLSLPMQVSTRTGVVRRAHDLGLEKQHQPADSIEGLRREPMAILVEDALEGPKASGLPNTRENYIAISWLDAIPDPWADEHEQQLPEQ